MAETKMTQAKAIEFVLATYGEALPADVKGKIEEIGKALVKKANAPRAQSAEVKENAKLRKAILDNMEEGKAYRINDLIAAVKVRPHTFRISAQVSYRVEIHMLTS